MAQLKYSRANSAHPDIPLPSPVEVEIGAPFTAPVPQTATGWTFEGWYTDRNYKNKWVDGTVVSGDLVLYSKWSQGGEKGLINFAYSVNSEDTTATLPASMDWTEGTRIYLKDLPSLPTPTVSTTTITGWYIDSTAKTLIDEDGVLVNADGVTFYAMAESSLVQSVSFEYAIGKINPDSDENFPMPISATSAWDADALGDDSVLPEVPIMGEQGEIIKLPTDIENLFQGTDEEAVFKGFYTSEVVDGNPITEVKLDGDQTVYALFEPKSVPEYVTVTYKLAETYIPQVDDSSEIVPTYEDIAPKDAASLMPAVPANYIGTEAGTNAVQYEWQDKVLKGSEYRLALPQNTTDRTDDYVFIGYYADYETTEPVVEIYANMQKDMTVYMKFAKKGEKVRPKEIQDKTYNISFEVDGFASSTDVPEGGIIPPDLELPSAANIEPIDIDKEIFPDEVDTYIPPEPKACEGFEFEGYYYYDEDGDKVDFVPGETEITSDLVLHPEFSIIEDLEGETTVVLVEMTPDTLGAPETLSTYDVPELPFAGITNPQIVKIGSTFDTKKIIFPELGNTFRVEGFYTLENNNGTYEMQRFTSGKVEGAMTLFVQFEATTAKPLDIQYVIDESSEEAKLVAPDFDYELAAASDIDSGGFGYEPRPADILSRAEGTSSSTLIISGYYTDSDYTTLFDPDAETQQGGSIEIYPKIEESSQIMVTVDYIPKTYNATTSDFVFEIPCAPELAMGETFTTFAFDKGATGTDILSEVGQPPIQQFWEPKKHEFGNCYWYTKVSDEGQTPQPFNPDGFTLSEPITLYPQFEANMEYPESLGVVKRDDIHLELSEARYGLGAASASSD